VAGLATFLALVAAVVPPPDGRWQYQLEGRVDPNVCAVPATGGPCVRPQVIDFDLYSDYAVAPLHERGGYAICYIDAGSIESYRPDWPRFKRWHRRHGKSLLGKPFSVRFPDERWANIGGAKQRAFLLRLMGERVRRCARVGFDAVEFDVVDAWSSGRKVTGWRVTYRDQLIYNRALARIAHRHGLAVGLKNDLGQIPDLIRWFDFAINEECMTYDECERLRAFVKAGKPVFHVEYENRPAAFCPVTEAMGFNSIKKSRDFSLFARPYVPCS
jgi:hypothetical protein